MRTTLERRRPARSPGDGGFTLIELMVTMAIAGLLFALAVAGWREYAATQAQRGTADAIVVLMRDAHQRAVTEGTPYAVRLTPDTATLLRNPAVDCTGGTQIGGEAPSRGGVTITTADSCVLFKARGTATPATVEVRRADQSKVYTITVEGLTGRASLS
jgi:type IV fimbrial biogenesis protein FimT